MKNEKNENITLTSIRERLDERRLDKTQPALIVTVTCRYCGFYAPFVYHDHYEGVDGTVYEDVWVHLNCPATGFKAPGIYLHSHMMDTGLKHQTGPWAPELRRKWNSPPMTRKS